MLHSQRTLCYSISILALTCTIMPLYAKNNLPTVSKDSPTQTIELKEIVVVASQTPKSIADIPATVWYVDNERLNQEIQSGKKLGAVLAATIPGLDASSQGRTNHGQYLRGRPMLVMIDGVSINSSRKVSRQLDSIDPANIERVEVLSGASAIYGGDATGGIINIVTKKGYGEGISGEFSLSGTSGFVTSKDRDLSASAALNFGSERINSRLAVAYSQNEAAYDGNGNAIVPDITQGSLQHNQSWDLLANSQIQLDDAQSLDLSMQYYQSQQDSPNGFYFGRNLAGLRANPKQVEVRPGFVSDRQASTKRFLINAQYRHDNFLGHSLYGQLSYRKEGIDFIPFVYGRYFAASSQNTNVFSFKGALHKAFGKLTLDYGIDGYIDKLKTDKMIFDPRVSMASGGLLNKSYKIVGRYPKTEVSSIAGFIQGEYKLTPKWMLSGGYRYQYLNNKIGDFIADRQQSAIALGMGKSADAIKGGTNNYNVGLLNLGLLYKITPQNHLWVNASQGFELPDPAKFYGQGKYSRRPNAQGHYTLLNGSNVSGSRLKGIKTNSIEVGSRFGNQQLQGQISVYYSLSDGSIDYDRQTLLIVQSDDKKRIYGLEAQMSYWPSNQFEIGAMAHLTKSRIKSKDGWKKPDITHASPSKTGAWLGWYGANASALLQVNTSLALSDTKNRRINSYTTVDLNYEYRLGENGSITAGVQNLLDKQYTTAWGTRAKAYYSAYGTKEMFDYKGRGRTFTVGYRHRF